MKKVILSVAFIALLSGCQDIRDDKNNQSKEPHIDPKESFEMLKRDGSDALALLKTESGFNIKSSRVNGSKLTIDANPNDWSDIDASATSGDTTLKVATDDEYLYLLITSTNAIDQNSIVLIDSDNQSTTGYKPTQWNDGGFDYIVGTVGTLYKTQTNSATFSIQRVGNSIAYRKNQHIIEMKIRKSDLDLEDRFGVAVQGYDNNWNMTAPLPSNGSIARYTHQDEDQGGEDEGGDTVAPIITLIGDSEITLNLNETYQELGATATDDVDGEVSVRIDGDVDTSIVGRYTVTYTATDRAGNRTTTTRIVNVVNNNTHIDTELTIDANPNDWSDIDASATSGDTTLKVATDDEYLYLLITSTNAIDQNSIVLIDSDNQSTTGYKPTQWNDGGFDYIVGTVGTLYKTQTNSATFSIQRVGNSIAYRKNQHIIEMKIRKSDLDLEDRFGVAVQGYDNNWNMTAPLPSNGSIARYTHQDEDQGGEDEGGTGDERVMIVDATNPQAPNVNLHDPDPTGAYFRYVRDPEKGYVLELHSHNRENSHHILGYDTNIKYNWESMPRYQNKLHIAWDSKFEGDFIIYVVLKFKTADGEIKWSDLVYTPTPNGYPNYTNSFMHISLGERARDGQWHHYDRDILEDLHRFYPGATIDYNDNYSGYVNGFAVRGSGWLTNIYLH